MSKSKTRMDYQTDRFERQNQRLEKIVADSDDISKLPSSDAKEAAKTYLRKEDELIWAWSRDPDSSLTQVEARDRAQEYDYGRYNISQSSVSRKLSKLDESMLTERVARLEMEESPWGEGAKAIMDTARYDYWDDIAPGVVEHYRKSLARLLCDMHTLETFMSYTTVTPQWARDRFPDVDPEIGLKFLNDHRTPHGDREQKHAHPPDSEINTVPEE